MVKTKGSRKENTGSQKQNVEIKKQMTGAENQPGAVLKDVKVENDKVFEQRLSRHHDELRWLYMELYGNSDMFAELCSQMKRYYDSRKESLKALDLKREKEGKWYRSRNMTGMMM